MPPFSKQCLPKASNLYLTFYKTRQLATWLKVSLKCQVQTDFQAYSKKKWDLFCILKFQLSLLRLLIGSVTQNGRPRDWDFNHTRLRSRTWNSGKIKEAEWSLYPTDKKWRTHSRSVLQSPTESWLSFNLGNRATMTVITSCQNGA